MKRRLAFLLAALAQLAFLGWLVADQERLRATGRAIVLSIEPVDPVDPLSGRYLAIRVKAARIDVAKLLPELAADAQSRTAASLAGEEVAVVMREKDGRWEPESIESARYGDPGASAVWLRGRVRTVSETVVDVDFGLDRYFIPAHAADPSPLLWRRADHELAIVARVSVEGRATIADLLVDGQPFAEWNAAQPK